MNGSGFLFYVSTLDNYVGMTLAHGSHNYSMSLSEGLIKKLKQKFEPLSMVQIRFRSHNIAIQTDSEGNAVKAFIGKLDEKGMIRGDRYSRVMVKDRNGNVLKDHWDRKGYAS
jgi:hypothetical protein